MGAFIVFLVVGGMVLVWLAQRGGSRKSWNSSEGGGGCGDGAESLWDIVTDANGDGGGDGGGD